MDTTSKRKSVSGIKVPTRVGNRVKRLFKSKPTKHQSSIPINAAILQHLVLLRRQVDSLTESHQQLECAVALFTKAAQLREERRRTVALVNKLAPKRWRVFLLLASGKCVKEVAAELGISIKTVGFHWRDIKPILRISSYAQAALLAQSAGLLDNKTI